MPGLFSKLIAFKAPQAKKDNFICAFIPENILENVEKAPDMPLDVRLSVRASIAASKEAGKEREIVGDSEKNPHEPNLPSSNRAQSSEVQVSAECPTKGCATLDIYSGMNSDYIHLPGTPLRSNDQGPVDDQIANDCFEAMNKAQSFFRDVYGWDSLDDKNVGLVGTVHYGANIANAFYYAQANQMIYGNGNQFMYNFTKSLDVVGHELTHGIIQHSSGMLYQYQSGALNEHCSDVFGALLEQYSQKQNTEEADWILAQDVLFPEEPLIAMRSMKAPGTAYDDPRVGKDFQPDHMDKYIYTHDDHGGVHWNSGIPNKAFYLAASRKGGYAWEAAGRTWFAAMTTATPNEQFDTFAKRTIAEAKKIVDSDFATIVEQAWKDVGVLKDSKNAGWFGWLWGKKA